MRIPNKTKVNKVHISLCGHHIEREVYHVKVTFTSCSAKLDWRIIHI